jgi:two-component system, NtrC family, nitrogen regulation sensor histidine kinase GlnL
MKELNKKCFVFTLNNKLKIVSWCKELEKVYGESIHQIRGLHLHKIMPLLNTIGKEKIMDVFKNGRPLTLRGQQIICFCGRKKADFQIAPLKDKTGKVKSVNVTAISHPDDTTSTRLRQSQRLLNIGKVAATLAHGVRSPLNAIKGCVTYIREKYDSEKELVEFSKIMEEEISRLDHFISNFLSTSISEKGLSKVNINKIIKKIAVLISLQAEASNCKVIPDYGRISPVMINAFHLEHAILNVIDNGMEAMPLGGTLSIKTYMENILEKDFVVVEITDTGCGIKFKKSSDIPVSRKNKGRGLGLFITREILQSYKGHMEIMSDKGVGTSLKLFIPASNK